VNMPIRIDTPSSEYGELPPPSRPGVSTRQVAIGVIGAVIVLGLGWKLLSHPSSAPPAPPPALVSTAVPLARDVLQWDDYVGRFAPSQTVEIRPRVSGTVTSIHFRDGAIVHRGDLLFTIDARPFAATLAEANANVASARSALALARADFGRVQSLTGDEAVAASETDSLRAKVEAAAAALGAAQARVQARALDVSFTRVLAPISGRISSRRVDIGNQVSGEAGANATLLTTINALDPIYFSFDASEGLFLKSQRDHAGGQGSPAVEVRLQDETGYRWKGKLDFADNGLDPRSGTIRLRATFANPGLFLTAGMFGNMRLASGGKVHALLVPDMAVQSDQARKTVLVAAADGTVIAKPVELGALVNGLRIIRSGLAPGDHVIISNTQAAVPGSKVKIKAGQIASDPAAVNDVPDAAAPIAAQATLVN
jgi:multidrug efflux system membrane fusion protein